MSILNTETTNGVNNSTTVVANSPGFAVPTQPPNSTGEAEAKAVWVVAASTLSANLPETGPVDGIWGIGGAGGGKGDIGFGANDGQGIGVTGDGADNGIGVVGSGANGVIGQTFNGIGVVGQGSVGGVVGLAGQQLTPFEGGPLTPFRFPGETVGVYGCSSDDGLQPSMNNVDSGVWGDNHNSSGNATGSGVLGTSESGRGGVFQSANAAQLRLVPSSTPLENTMLLQNGQVGDLYFYSVAQEVGTSGTFDFTSILWLCLMPALSAGSQAVWAQIQLGDTIGG